jgi:deoxyhypusine synthase
LIIPILRIEEKKAVRRPVPMSFDADDFDVPVEDYAFSEIESVPSLIDQMAKAGGFTATKLAHARDILREAMEKSQDEGVLNWLSFPACLCATGTRGFFVEAIRRKAFNVIITTCGTLDHDIARTYQAYFHGAFELDDVELGEAGLNRLGNVIVPNSCYGEILEKSVLPWLVEIEAERRAANPENPWLGFGSIELCWAFGDRIEDESSLLHWAAKHRIPIVIPGLSDGSIGAQLFMHRQKSPDFMIDFLADEQILSDLTWTCDESHALMVGGGISKHHVIWWNQYRGGLDSAVAITTAPEHDGSLSGARLREAISWGKIRPEAPQVTVEGDASVLLPLLGSDLFN